MPRKTPTNPVLARSPQAPKRKKPADNGQFERFVEAAREIGMDEDPEALERAFDKIVRPKKS
jgi:hypothetical protein